MSFLTKHINGLSAAVQASVILFTLYSTTSLVTAQITNGVFDPTKVMVAKEKVKQVQVIEQNIALAKEFNRTLGTPSHPRPQIPPPEGGEMNQAGNSGGQPPRYGPEPVSVPTFDLPPDVEQRNQARAKARKNREKPTVVANKLDNPPPMDVAEAAPPKEKPSVSANPVSIRGVVPTFETPVTPINPGPTPNEQDPQMELANNPEVGKRGFFSRFKRSSQTAIEDIDVTSSERVAPELPPAGANVSMNGELDVIPADPELALVQENGGEMIPLDGDVILPSHSSSPDMDLPQRGGSRGGFLSMFSKQKNRTLDVPDHSIPISIGSGNAGSPYSSDTFHAGSGYSPLLDGPADRDQIRDMTQPGILPIGSGMEGIAARHSHRPAADVSQYMIVKSDTLFEPFKYGTEEVDKENAFELYSGSTVKDLGILGLKRMVQIDSGEAGLIPKFSVRQLAVSEEVVMSNGLSKARPWYSILDTEPEIDEFASSLSTKPAAGPKPQRPWNGDSPKKLANGKPDSDTSQYYIVSRNGVTFAPFGSDGEEIDLASSFEIPAGAIVKIVSTPGSNHIVVTDSGEGGVLPTDGVRPLNDSEKTLMAGGISKGRPWYSILDTEADMAPFVAAGKPSAPKPQMSGQPPKAPVKPKTPKSLPDKPASDLSQYYLVKSDGVLFEPFRYGSEEVDTDSSFEMYAGAVLKVLSTVDNKHIVQTDSGENGVISTSGLRTLTSAEQEQMGVGISKGRPWYSILDTAPAE